jgi:HEAT repeat protein
VLLLLLSSVTAQVAVADRSIVIDDAESALVVEIKEDLVTLNARDVSVREVLNALTHESGLIVNTDAPLTDPIAIDFENLSLAEALERILGPQGYLMLAHADDASRSTVWIFSATPDTEPDSSSNSHQRQSVFEALEADLLSDDLRVRGAAIRGLRKLQDESVVAPISLALTDEDRKIRVKAIYALADIGGAEAAVALAASSTDENPYVRAESAYALGMIGGDTAVGILEHALLDPSLDVRQSAVEAFTDIGGGQAARALAVALQDSDASLRVAAVEALANIDGEIATRLVEQALEDQDLAVRQAAKDALTGR